MKVLFLDRSGIARTLKKLMAEYDEYYWAVAWGTKNTLSDELAANPKKIKQLIFGTHFYQTDPKLLERFLGKKFARVMPNDPGGTFHPKVYLFIKGNKAAAIVGSANFTRGGMKKNTEAALYIDTSANDSSIADIFMMLDGAWEESVKIDREFLDGYTVQHNATAHHRKELQRERKVRKPKSNAKHKGLQLWSWDEYAKKVKGDPFLSFSERISLLREARRLFASVGSFSALSDDARRGIGGFLGKGVPHQNNSPALDWGWFGSMKGAGSYKSLVVNNSKYLSEALDQIPLTGDVRKEQFDRYITLFTKAFRNEEREGRVPTASRLLAMKRPDVFICIDSKNRKGLSDDLGFSPTTLDFEKYWDEVVMPISESLWWHSDRPSGSDGALWDGRAAMLDAIYYAENS